MAYEKTQHELARLRKKVHALKKRNMRDQKLERKIKFLVCNDFQKWTNSFSRKSVMWDNKKQKLMGAPAIVEEINNGRGTSSKKGKHEKCCGRSPQMYGH